MAKIVAVPHDASYINIVVEHGEASESINVDARIKDAHTAKTILHSCMKTMQEVAEANNDKKTAEKIKQLADDWAKSEDLDVREIASGRGERTFIFPPVKE